MTDEKLFSYFIEQTNKRFDKVDENFKSLHKKFDDLTEFKTTMQVTARVSSRWISTIISILVGIATFTSTLAVTLHVSRAERQALLDAAKVEKAPALNGKDPS